MNSTQVAQIARGKTQRFWWARMLEATGCPNPNRLLIGEARKYAGRYLRSFRNMMQRAKQQGYAIERTAGARGGEWGATYYAKKEQHT